ncbi:energy-coupling factor transporter transmembrane protein EcfT [Quadrisphaera sp. RL12-1S]|nr:energy-coupling factor transporter transmembrane protein EcfT [Quadrisphaera sp. RL12-1S]
MAAPGAPQPVRVRGWRLDPRTRVALVLLTSLAVMRPGGEVHVPAAAGLALGLAVASRAWRRLLVVVVVLGALTLLVTVLPAAVPHPVTAALAVASAFALRFAVVAGVAAHLVATTPPGELVAGLRAARLPRSLTVSAAVMLRFLPVVAAEAAAVVDAMRLRGLLGWRRALRSPVATSERFVVPLVASSLRAAEDLSASALLRGLGGAHRPTALRAPRLGPADALCAAAVAALALSSGLVGALVGAWSGSGTLR